MSSYAVVIHEGPEGGFWAEVPASSRMLFPGRDHRGIAGSYPEPMGGVLETLRERGQEPETNIRILDVAV